MVRNRKLSSNGKWLKFLIIYLVFAIQIYGAVSVKICMRENAMSDPNSSNPYIYVQNTGDEVINNFIYYYYLQTENSQNPLLDIYYLSQYETAVIETVSTGHRIKYTVTNANLAPGAVLPGTSGNSVSLHYSGWPAWDKTNDFSNNLNNSFQENTNIAVYFNGNKIYGNEPDTSTELPQSPNSLNATAISYQRIDLSWIDSSNNETGFRIERSVNGGAYSETGTVGANVTSFQNSGLSENSTYSYRIRAYNNVGNSEYSAVANATTPQGPEGYISREMWTNVTGTTVSSIPSTTPPNVTNSLTSLESSTNYGNSYGQRIRGYITAPATGQYTFWIASDDNSQLWVSTNDQVSAKVNIASVTGYTNSREWNKYSSQKSGVITLSEGIRYYVEILHKEGDQSDNLAVGWLKPGQSGTVPSEVVPGMVLSPYQIGSIPEPPALLNAAAISSQRIDLSWVDSSDNEDGFRIERSVNGSSFSETGTVSANVTAYNSTGLTANTNYSYRVRSYNSAGNSDYCASASATTLNGPAGYVNRELWTDVTGINVSDIPVTTTANIFNTLTTLESTSNNGDSYGQRIRGYITAPTTGQYTFWISSDDNSQLWLSTSDQVSAKVNIASVTGYANSQEWNKYSSQKSSVITLSEGVRYYIEILHKEGDQNDNLAVGWLKPGQNGTVPTEVVPGSVLSPFFTATVPDGPTGLLASVISDKQVNLAWNDVSNNETGFRIERALGSGSFVQIATLTAGVSSYLDNGLLASTEYLYRVCAYNDIGNSSYSNTVSTTTTAEPLSAISVPVNLLAYSIYSSERSIANDRSNLAGYGAIGSNGYLEIGASANVQGDLFSGGNILLRSSARIYGDVYANGTVTLQEGAQIIGGSENENLSNELLTIPQFTNIISGTEVKTAYPGQFLDLTPGMYKKLTVESNGKVRFFAGTYTFDTLIVRTDAEILYNISMYDEVNVFIKNEVEIGDRSKAKFEGSDTYPLAVKFYSNDPNMFRIGTQVQFTGIIVAPHAEVSINDGVQFNGGIYARKVIIEAIATLESGIINPDKDFDNDLVPTYSEIKLHTDPRDSLDYKAIGIPSNSTTIP